MPTTIALYGGSFNPITFGHLVIVSEILNSNLCDQIWLVPSGDGREDKRSKVNSLHRLEMSKLAIQDIVGKQWITKNESFSTDCPIQVCNIETKEGYIPSYSLIKRLESEYPQHTFKFIIGSDLIKDIYKWDSGTLLLSHVHFIIIPRIPYQQISTKRFTLQPTDTDFNSESTLSSHHTNVVRPSTSECSCGMIFRDFPVDASQQPQHWECMKCLMAHHCQWVMIETSISSTEVRRRIMDILQKILNATETNLLPVDTKDQFNLKQDLIETKLKGALGLYLQPSVIHYIVKHQLYW